MLPENFIRSVVEDSDIVDVVGRYVPLKKRGRNYFACCPFHGENTPSFSVDPKNGFYHCFGCGASGDSISFLTEHNGIGFTEAVTELALQQGKELPQLEAEEMRRLERERKRKRNLAETNAVAADYYVRVKNAEPSVCGYLTQRGISAATAETFAIGYAPDDYHHLRHAFSPYPSPALLEAGLTKHNDDNNLIYDTFRDRLIFPVRNSAGLVLGFGGRYLGSHPQAAKYLNTAETEIFRKREILYGLYECRNRIREQKTVYITEGYFDVLGLYEKGLAAVAVMGTAFQENHFDLLRHYSRRLVFVFDGDKAGFTAAERAMKECLSKINGTDYIGFCLLPQGTDAADTALSCSGKAALEQILDSHTLSLGDFFIACLKQRFNLDSDDGKSGLINQAKLWMTDLKDKVLTEMLTHKIAEAVGLAAGFVRNHLGKGRYRRNWRDEVESASKEKPLEVSLMERIILSALCNPVHLREMSFGVFETVSPVGIEQEDMLFSLLLDLKEETDLLPENVNGRREAVEYWKKERPQWYARIGEYCIKANPNLYKMDGRQFENLFVTFFEKQEKVMLKRLCDSLRAKLKDGSADEKDKQKLLECLARL